MNRRDQISLSTAEQRAFLAASKTIILSTIDRYGFPDSVPMWFVVDEDGAILMTTYAKSQKVRNVRRDPKVALLVESGVTYETLKGVLIRGVAEIRSDPTMCVSTLQRIHDKMSRGAGGVEAAMLKQAAKRVVIRVVPQRVSSWDHHKLGGTY